MKFGYDVKKGITSDKTKEIARERVLENKDLCIDKNLILGGKETRYKKGQKGLGKYKRSLQTQERLKNNKFIKK
jgi:hypothetical protein